MSDNILWIIRYEREDGQTAYRCRGDGKNYQKFYRWIATTPSYRCVYENFPWDHFVINDPTAERIMCEIYGKFITNEDEED